MSRIGLTKSQKLFQSCLLGSETIDYTTSTIDGLNKGYEFCWEDQIIVKWKLLGTYWILSKNLLWGQIIHLEHILRNKLQCGAKGYNSSL